MELLFFEKQRFRQTWLWLLLLALNTLFIYGFIQQVLLGIPFGTKPASDAALGLIVCIMLAITFFLFSMRMETKITSEGIFARFFPLQLSPERIYWEDVAECYVREYKAAKEFGGWGRRGVRHDRVLSVAGNQGIQIVFVNGNRLLLGTQRPLDVEQILSGMGKIKKSG